MPNEFELNSIRLDPVKLAMIRGRLSDISWWMRLLSQNIAQRANKEDEEVGKFWQARYRAVRLLDEAAILACSAYVDLNPIRAALAETLEGSDFTSVQKRVDGLRVNEVGRLGNEVMGRLGDEEEVASQANVSEAVVAVKVAGHLAPLSIDELHDAIGPCCHTGGQRASDKGFLPMTEAAYVDLLDWTARQIRADKCGATPATMEPVFERLGMSGEVWCGMVKDFGRLFYAVAGRPHAIDAHRSRDGQRRYKTRAETRELLTV